MESNTEKEKKLKRCIRIIQRILTVFLVLCIGYLALYQWDSYRQTKQNDELREIAGAFAKSSEASAVLSQASKEDASPDTETPESGSGEIREPSAGETRAENNNTSSGYDLLLEINPQIKGWISIPGTQLSFPLLQGEDNDFYLDHDIYGQESRYGSIFVDFKADLYGNESNIIIYGHHMRDGNMFGSLKEYKKEAYCKEHPSFFLFLPEEEREYKIIAVLDNDIYSRESEPFQYYDYERIENKEMFEKYLQGIKEHSLYDTGITAAYGDELVTLCTCDYGSSDQRLLVVGRRLSSSGP